MTQTRLERLCRAWQARLGLLHWTIDVSLVPVEVFRDDGVSGHNEYERLHRRASIRILRKEDYEVKPAKAPWDPERTLVHELLHLVFDPLHVHADRSDEEEQAINGLADALVGLKRAA